MGVEEPGEDRRRVVAAVAAERGGTALRVARDESGHHDVAARSARAPVGQSAPALVPVHANAHLAGVHDQDVASNAAKPTAGLGPQRCVEQVRRQHYAPPGQAGRTALPDARSVGWGTTVTT